MKTIIFVCHGNICRSPAAEWIAKKILQERGREKEFKILSRALSYEEINNDIYPPMKQTLEDFHVPFKRHYADILSKEDYEKADYIFYMDSSNKRIISYRYPMANDKFHHINEFTPQMGDIEDPWYSGRYTLVVQQLIVCINNIFDKM